MPSIFLHIDGCRKIVEKKKFFRNKPDATMLALIGSIIPDLELFGILKNVHGRCKEFYDYLEKRDKRYLPLAFGMIVHEHHDNIIETHFVGDNEKEARKLIKEYDEKISRIKVAPEILIEHSLDCSLVEAKPELIAFTNKFRNRISRKQIKIISEHLAGFFGGDKKSVAWALRTFKKFDLYRYLATDHQHKLWQRYMFLISQNKELGRNQVKGRLINIGLKLAVNYLYGRKILKEKKGGLKGLITKAKERFNQDSLFSHVKISEEELSKLPFELL